MQRNKDEVIFNLNEDGDINWVRTIKQFIIYKKN